MYGGRSTKMRNRDGTEMKRNAREPPNGAHPHHRLIFHRGRRTFQKNRSRGSAETSMENELHQGSVLSPKLVKAKGCLLPCRPRPQGSVPGAPARAWGSCVSSHHLPAGALRRTFQSNRNNHDAQRKGTFLFSLRQSSPCAQALSFPSLQPDN